MDATIGRDPKGFGFVATKGIAQNATEERIPGTEANTWLQSATLAVTKGVTEVRILTGGPGMAIMTAREVVGEAISVGLEL